MRCTDCSQPVPPVVAIDIDGTLGDFHGHFISFAEKYVGGIKGPSELPTYDGSEPFRKWGCEIWDIDERTWYDIKLAYRQGAQKRSMPAYPWATYLCLAMRRSGSELWLTTTRPYLRLDNIDPDTRAWLARNLIEYDGLLYDDSKYERLAELVDPERVVAVLDDLPEQFEAAAKSFGWRVPIMRKTQYNRGVPCEQSVESLYAATEMIERRIQDWKEKHGDNGIRKVGAGRAGSRSAGTAG